MPNKHLVTFILPEFIKLLKSYNETYGVIRASVDRLYRLKHANASKLLEQLEKLAATGNISLFKTEPLERAVSRQSNLTMPSRGTQTSEWAATPMMRGAAVLFRVPVATVNDEDWAPSTPAIAADDDLPTDEADSLLALNEVLERERQKIHKARAGYKTGSFDGILYAMSRCLCFIKWFYSEINIPVDSPDEDVGDIEPNQRYCLQLIWLIASYMCHYSFDRACKRWDHHHLYTLKSPNYYILDNKYYFNSGMVNFPKLAQDDMAKLDGYGNTMVNCLGILSDIYLEADTSVQLSSLDYVTTVLLDAKVMPIEYMDKVFLERVNLFKSKLIMSETTETVVRPNPLDAALFDSRRDEDITIEEERLDTMSPSKIPRTHKPSIDV